MQAAMTLERVELYIPLLSDPVLVSRLHCAVVYCARSAHQPELMLRHGDLAVVAPSGLIRARRTSVTLIGSLCGLGPSGLSGREVANNQPLREDD